MMHFQLIFGFKKSNQEKKIKSVYSKCLNIDNGIVIKY